jgi:PAS domain S-box-containing protein
MAASRLSKHKSTTEITPSATDWLAGGGELGRRIAELDWSNTSLGPIEGWPQSLKTSVNLILNARHPMWVGWGKEAIFIYNDAYIQVLSLAKHPWALGKPAAEVWPEIWDICGPLADKVFEKGEASFVDDIRLLMNRGDFVEETYYSFSYSPIRDESGSVAGLFCPSTEVTPKVINARRLQTLAELSANALLQKTTEAACLAVATTLEKNREDIPFAILYLLDGENRRARIEQVCGLPAGVEALTPCVIDLASGPAVDATGDSKGKCLWPLAEVLKSAQAQEVSVQGIDGLPLGTGQQRISEAMVLPVTSGGEGGPLGVLVAGVSPARRLDAEYRTFYELVAGQIATAIQNAHAAEEERKRLEALAEIDRAKTAFFSNVSHEFRTPLTLMLGPVEDLLAKSHVGLSPAAKNQLELVSRNGARLLRLVNTLLDFSRIEAGRMQAIYLPTDLAAFTVELASVFRSATDKAGLRLELDCPKLDEPVYVDRGMWEKIVLNLISNAFKFTFEGAIEVSLAKAGNHAELRVRDTGVGIPAQEIARLFDRFHRVENTRSRTHEGSGIGLALVQELVKLHGGSVRVESAVGVGTTFIVSLPLGKAHLAADRIGGSRTLASTALGAAPFVEEALRWLPDAAAADAEEEILPSDKLIPVACPPLAGGEKRPMILVADDNADMRQYLVRLMEERYEVRTAPDGKAALEAVREGAPGLVPDLVLTDVMMPNLDGFGLLRELRADPATRTIPIILLSARAGEESRVEGMEHGADDYLIKPFSARELLARVQTHLEMARVRKEAGEALRRRTEQFETLLNEAPLGVYLVDGDLRIRAANPLATRTFGNVRNVTGRDFDELVHILWPEPYADEVVEKFRHTLETGEPYFVAEHVGQRQDLGTREVYEWQINRITLPEGGYGVVCYFRDIAAQVEAREAIAASEQRLRLATQAAELGIWQWDLEHDQANWENDRLYEIFGRTREQGVVSGAEFREKYCHPEDLPGFEQALSQAIATGERFYYQARILLQDENLSHEDRCRWVELNGQVERGGEGTCLRMLGTTGDITRRKQAEEMLNQHRERFGMVAKAAQVGFWFCDLPFDKLIWDDLVKEHFWLPRDADVTIDLFYERLHPDDRERTRQAIAESNANNTPYDIEYRTISGDGRQKWIRAMGKTFYDAAGQPRRFDGITLDITEHKQAVDALRQSEERLRLAQKAGHAGTWEFNFATAELIASPELLELFGLQRRAPTNMVEEFRGVVHPDDLPVCDEALAKAIESGGVYHVEFRIIRGDGEERWIESTAQIFYDPAGKPLRVIGVSTDITERKRIAERERAAAAEAMSAHAKFRAVFEQTPVFAGIMALDGTLVDANRLCLEACGYRAEDVLGKPFWETGWWQRSQEAQAKIRAASRKAAQGEAYRETLVYHWADGTERLTDFALHPIHDSQGRILFLHPTGVDITDLKRAEEKYRGLAETLDAEVRVRTSEVVRQSEQLRDLSSRLLQAQDAERRHIARELHDSAGQILAALGMSVSLVSRHARKENPEVAKYTQQSQELVQQLSQEIRTMSYLLHPPLLDDMGLAEALRWYIEGLAERSGLEIVLDIPKHFERPSRELELVMFRVVQECLTNIHRHSGSKTAVIRIQRGEEGISLEVEDKGKGIPADRLSAIQSQGAGVGLRGMRERVRHFGGHMQIEASPGGTKISFAFPQRENTGAKASGAAPHDSAPQNFVQ